MMDALRTSVKINVLQVLVQLIAMAEDWRIAAFRMFGTPSDLQRDRSGIDSDRRSWDSSLRFLLKEFVSRTGQL
jgi:hypothetical protein